MANYVITAANVGIAEATARPTVVQAGEALTEGQAVYLNTTDSKYYKADATSSASAAVAGIVVSPAAADGYALIQSTKKIIIGATVVAGDPIYLSATASGGNLCPHGDLVSTNYVTKVGHAVSTTEVLINIEALDIQVA